MHIQFPNPIEHPEEIIRVIENGLNGSRKALDNPLLRALHKQALQLLVLNAVSFFPPTKYSNIFEKYEPYVYKIFGVVNRLFFEGKGHVERDTTDSISGIQPPNITLNVQRYGFINIEHISHRFEEHSIRFKAYVGGIVIVSGRGQSISYNIDYTDDYGEDVTFLKDFQGVLLNFINFGYYERSLNLAREYLSISTDEFLVPNLHGGNVNLLTYEKGKELICVTGVGGVEQKYTFNSDLLSERFDRAKYLKTLGYYVKQG